MDKVYIIKIGGEVVDDKTRLIEFIKAFDLLAGKKILVHGGGKLASQVAEGMNIPQNMVDGRRVTDGETLKVVTMVYAGLINKEVVALMQREGINAVGLTGADGNLILAHKRRSEHDYGFVGDIDQVNTGFLKDLLKAGITPVVAPITHDGKGQLLNTNADTIARMIGESLSGSFDVHLVYSFGKPGVLRNADDEHSVIRELKESEYLRLKEEKAIYAGMIPKLDNAFAAIKGGIRTLSIGKASKLSEIIQGRSGTSIINE